MAILVVRDDLWRFRAKLDDVSKRQLPFACARALTESARAAQQDVTRSLPAIFDRPTPFTQRAIGIKAARKNDLTAMIFVKDIQAGYLRLEETGGVRLPTGRALVLPVDVQRNAYGNIPKGLLKRLKAKGKTGVFVGTVKGVAGFWQRGPHGSIRLLAAFRSKAVYRPRFDFRARVGAVVGRTFPTELAKQLAAAIASARG